MFDLVIPAQMAGDQVDRRYNRATFDRENAVVDEDLEFITLDHEAVRSMMAYALDMMLLGARWQF